METRSSEDHHRRHHQARATETPRQCGRRKIKSGESASAAARKKKKPQRGMGVAQLERLLRDQSLKKIANHNPLSVNGTVPQPVLHHQPCSFVFSPGAAVSGSIFPAAMNNNSTICALPLHQFPKLGSYAACGGELFSSYSPSSAPPFSAASHHDLSGFGGSTNDSNIFNVGNVIHENSKEPNFTFSRSSLSDRVHQRCNICHKTKRENDGNLAYNHSANIVRQNQDYFGGFSSKPIFQTVYADKLQSMVTVEKKNGSSSSSSTTGVVEYEFFPEKSSSVSRSSFLQDDDMVMMTSTPTPSEPSSPVVAAMASSFGASFDASSSTSTLDLSLRLSY